MIKFYLSADFTVDANDGLLAANRTVPALAASASSSGSTSVTIPAGTVPGFYYVLGKADADGSVDESYETNNTVARGIQVTN